MRPEAPDETLDLALLAQRFVEQRQPGATVDEVRSLFEHQLATACAGATITQYLPVLLWRQALDRWPGGAAAESAGTRRAA
jgi:hypothetical protein